MSAIETKNASTRVIFDAIAICTIGLPIVLCELHVLKPYKRGFFCNDPSIHYPLQSSTFNSLVALILGGGIPTVVILAVEFVRSNRTKQKQDMENEDSIKTLVFGREIPPIAISLYKYLGGLFFACELGGLTTDVIKFSLGVLRPHFLAVCIPDWSRVNCTDALGNFRYVTENVCTNKDADEVAEARLSFPSGHANIAFAGFIYLCLYLQVRIQWRNCHLMKHTCQALLLFLAVYLSATRVSDFQHHMSDILGGALIGTFSAVFVMVCVTEMIVLNPAQGLVNSLRRDMLTMAHNYARMDSSTTTGTGFASESVDLEDIVFTSI
eukprot:GHVO01058394.1.p1 GENE.GHVO01058394.1~~GHVO01058394.1.p1  ORF type:complete len:324 (+),score=28.10 GHVO01058394.1:22-993(+)